MRLSTSCIKSEGRNIAPSTSTPATLDGPASRAVGRTFCTAECFSLPCSAIAPWYTKLRGLRLPPNWYSALMNHFAVLMGGWSAEREVSLRSGVACAEALKDSEFKVTVVD